MPDIERTILMAGMPADFASRYETTLAERGFGTDVIPDPDDAIRHLDEHPVDAVVAAYPLAPGTIGRMVTALRSRDSINSAAGLVLLTSPSHLRSAAGLVGRGVTKAVSTEENPAVLGVIVERMVESNRAMLERLPVQIEVNATIASEPVVWRTENLSGAGMLIGSEDPPSLGTRFRFALSLNGEPVEGVARVVRHVLPGREATVGFGARFSSFDGDGQARLIAYLRSQTSAPETI
jgi:hypothetical protein